jgi:hypothetical protein
MPPLTCTQLDDASESSFLSWEECVPAKAIRSVCFNDDATVVHEFERVADQDREKMWFTKDEYTIINVRDYLISKLVTAGSFRETEEHTSRGIEKRSLEKGVGRKSRAKVVNAVLDEQDYQFERGLNAPGLIAKVYILASLRARVEDPVLRGRRDAAEASALQKTVDQ